MSFLTYTHYYIPFKILRHFLKFFKWSLFDYQEGRKVFISKNGYLAAFLV